VDATLSEWLQLLLRWFHIFAGILWFGSTWFFSWLDRTLEDLGAVKGKTTGETYLVHSGGFYYVQKQRFVPGEMPPVLHWFKWEALLTWVSGAILLTIVYYLGGAMVEPESKLGLGSAIAIGVSAMVIAWIVYDLLWTRVFVRSEQLGVVVCYGLMVGAAYSLSKLGLTGRAMYIHVGAMLGTIMVANVWMRILPAQSKMLAAVREQRDVDHALAERAKQRSKQNTYMGTTVVVIMISNHFPTFYGSDYGWAMLAGLTIVGWIGRALYIRPPKSSPTKTAAGG
jgi:uncharacterized membrane protein